MNYFHTLHLDGQNLDAAIHCAIPIPDGMEAGVAVPLGDDFDCGKEGEQQHYGALSLCDLLSIDGMAPGDTAIVDSKLHSDRKDCACVYTNNMWFIGIGYEPSFREAITTPSSFYIKRAASEDRPVRYVGAHSYFSDYFPEDYTQSPLLVGSKRIGVVAWSESIKGAQSYSSLELACATLWYSRHAFARSLRAKEQEEQLSIVEINVHVVERTVNVAPTLPAYKKD